MQVDYGSAVLLMLAVVLTSCALLLFFRPLLGLSRFLLRSAGYSFLVTLANLITQNIAFSVGVNAVTACLYGFFGIYGVLGSYALRLWYG